MGTNDLEGKRDQRRIRSLAAPLGLGCVVLAGLAASAYGQSPFNGAAAQFTTDQAAKGKIAYADNCAACHGDHLDDGEFGPALKGVAFAGQWGALPPKALLDYIQARMPPTAPGSLGGGTYSSIVAYILQNNGVPIGQGAAAAPPSQQPPSQQPAQQASSGGGGDPFGDASKLGLDSVYDATVAARNAKLDGMKPVTDAMLKAPPAGDWLMWRRTYDAHGYSPLAQVNTKTVGGLRAVWSWSLPSSQNEMAPVVHDGVMFVESAGVVQALDAATGDLLWQYRRPMPDGWKGGPTSRVKGFTLYKDKLIVPAPDGHLIALEAKTGKLAWDYAVIGDKMGADSGMWMDGGPVIANGKVVIGVSLGITHKGGCYIVGLDADTGKEIWRFHTVDQSPVGKDSWNGAPVDERYGGGVWTAGSYDPALNLVYFGVGNTYDTATLLQPHAQKGASDDGLYTDSTLALDPDTGKLVWHFQHVHRDVWDMDWVFEQTLVTLQRNGKPQRYVVTGSKLALFDGVDAETGKYAFSKDIGLQNLVVGVDPKTGEKTINPALKPEPGVTKFLCPTSNGFRNWPATAFNPQTKILYVPLMLVCADFTWNPRSPEKTADGGLDMRFSPRLRPDHDGDFGRIEAINLETGKVVWSHSQRTSSASSMLATAGGLVFNGSVDRRFHAFDEATGKILWETRLNGSPSSTPVTYEVNGRQYVAVVAGGGGAYDATGRSLSPEIAPTVGAPTITVFALPK